VKFAEFFIRGLITAVLQLPYNFALNSSAVTAACFKMLRNVPTASSACKGTTQPVTPAGPITLEYHVTAALANLRETQLLQSANRFCP
jgi:hypothetical protein